MIFHPCLSDRVLRTFYSSIHLLIHCHVQFCIVNRNSNCLILLLEPIVFFYVTLPKPHSDRVIRTVQETLDWGVLRPVYACVSLYRAIKYKAAPSSWGWAGSRTFSVTHPPNRIHQCSNCCWEVSNDCRYAFKQATGCSFCESDWIGGGTGIVPCLLWEAPDYQYQLPLSRVT